MKTLSIDTSRSKEVIVGIRINGKEDVIRKQIGMQKTQTVLPFIDKILSKHRLRISDIDAIEVNTGPGSFTGLRIGVAIANALGFALKIPVNKKKIGEIVTPVYEARPQ